MKNDEFRKINGGSHNETDFAKLIGHLYIEYVYSYHKIW